MCTRPYKYSQTLVCVDRASSVTSDVSMADATFRKQKQQCLSKVDLSKKGSVDEPIGELIELINQQDHYFTTSSCSGRILLYEQERASTGSRKKGCHWLFTSHECCGEDLVVAAVKESTGDATFKFEPFILHTQCSSVERAQRMHVAAVAAGFRNSGMTVGSRGKVIQAVRSTHSLEVPLTRQGELLVSTEYIGYLCKLANTKMDDNFQMIQRFLSNLKSSLEKPGAVDELASKKNRRRKGGWAGSHGQADRRGGPRVAGAVGEQTGAAQTDARRAGTVGLGAEADSPLEAPGGITERAPGAAVPGQSSTAMASSHSWDCDLELGFLNINERHFGT